MDAFDLLALPRRPWLEPAKIRSAFQSEARRLHPDRDTGNAADFARLNAAHLTLENPASRLRLLIGDAVIPATPPDFQLGFDLGAFLRRADALIERQRSSAGALARALLADERAGARREAASFAEAIERLALAAEERLRELDAAWPDILPADLAALAGAFTFLDRWSAQLRERSVELAAG